MQDEVKASQVDREAAADYLLLQCKDEHAAMIRKGDMDGSFLVQAFARHRHQAERDTRGRMELVAWLERHDYGDGEVETHIHLADSNLGQHIAKYQTHKHGKTMFPLYALPPAPEAGQ